jgi:uncharacterized protein YlxP (DUF503 family)
MASVGVLTLEMRFEHAHSLKDKRHYVRGLKDRLRAAHNVAVSEIDHQDLWQSGLVAAVTVSPSRERAQQVLQAAEDTAAAFLGPCLIAATVEWLA